MEMEIRKWIFVSLSGWEYGFQICQFIGSHLSVIIQRFVLDIYNLHLSYAVWFSDETDEEVEPIDSWEEEDDAEPEVCSFTTITSAAQFEPWYLHFLSSDTSYSKKFRLAMEGMVVELFYKIAIGVNVFYH